MSVTVGIASLGEDPGQLVRAVDSAIRSAALLGPDAEVLVVVNGRGRVPELDAVASPALRVRYLDRPGVGRARNVVLDEARHDTILFTDDDCLVPLEWCSQLAAALHEPGTAAVGAPVRLVVAGPVSAFCDYVRVYDAVQSGVDGPLLLVTANCGLRRDRIGRQLHFDTCSADAGAEDTAYALALSKAGLRSVWLADATPVRHEFSERIEEITGRYRRYARNGLHHYLEHGTEEMRVVGMLDLLRQRVAQPSILDRRYAEFVDAPVRTAFSVYDALATATTAVGYLHGLGAALGTPLLDLDIDALDSAWRVIGERTAEQAALLTPQQWARLQVDYRAMAQRITPVDPLVTQVWDSVRRFARPTDAEPTGPVAAALRDGAPESAANTMTIGFQLRRSFDDAVAAGEVTTEWLDSVARAAGTSLRVALDMIELTLRFDADPHVQQWRARRGQRAADRVAV